MHRSALAMQRACRLESLVPPMSLPVSVLPRLALHHQRSRASGKARHPLLGHFPHRTGPKAHEVTLFAAMVVVALLVTLSGLIGLAEILLPDLRCSEEGISCQIEIGARVPTTPKPAG
jgi:hypothetical protein